HCDAAFVDVFRLSSHQPPRLFLCHLLSCPDSACSNTPSSHTTDALVLRCAAGRQDHCDPRHGLALRHGIVWVDTIPATFALWLEYERHTAYSAQLRPCPRRKGTRRAPTCSLECARKDSSTSRRVNFSRTYSHLRAAGRNLVTAWRTTSPRSGRSGND
ncbi:hypothetical protein BJY52DRAFT_1423194, partial [Lactarius psammicola]